MQKEIGPNEVASICWGSFTLPGLPVTLKTEAEQDGDHWYFKVSVKAKRKVEPVVKQIFAELRRYLKDGGSIYQGKAIKLNLDDEMPNPTFMDVAKVNTSNMFYPKAISEALEVNVFTPIERIGDLQASGIPFKRGILFTGLYGTGKTLAATAAAKLAVIAGVTFIYIREASQLSRAIEFAKMYAKPGAVIFCEDIDRVTEGDRDAELDELLNIIDGVDTKDGQIMVVLTTNNFDAIHPAMLREGRLDAVIEFVAPDATTAEKIIRSYCGAALATTEDLAEVGQICAGQIPATLAEVVKRAKLAQLSLQSPGTTVQKLTAEALRRSADSMSQQIKLRDRRIKEEREKGKKMSIDDLVAAAVTSAASNGAGDKMAEALAGNESSQAMVFQQVKKALNA